MMHYNLLLALTGQQPKIVRASTYFGKSFLAYFKKRINQARKDVEFGREWVINNAKSRSDQEAVLNAVKFKTEVLWAQLDALYYSYVDPGNIPPGSFIPNKLDN